MWHEYPIPADFEKQKEVIKKLRKWIQKLEKDNLIAGFAFNHYFSNPDVPNELRIRFEYTNEQNREGVEAQLENEMKKILPSYVRQEHIWDSESHILQAYEFGSRCAFLAWELIECGRFPVGYFSRACVGITQEGILLSKVPFEFQAHFNHGAMNSLGVPKAPDEQAIHVNHLMDSTKSKTKQELIKWLQANLRG